MQNKLIVTSSPHIHTHDTTQSIMLDVIIALVPATVFGIILFGYRAALVIAVSIACAVASEFVWNIINKKENSLHDLSAIVTGLLLALNLPASMPLWMVAIGSAVAIIVVKQMFGGLGQNFVNPAIAARIVLLVSFPAAMTNFYEILPADKIVTSATPLARPELFADNYQLFIGMHPGSIGETSAILLLIGGLYLIMRRVVMPTIPVAFIGTVFVFSWILSLVNPALNIDPLAQILSGGLFLGAIFMATDYVTSPATPVGQIIFGVGCGLLTVVIRQFAALPEGVSYAILLMNILVPHINRLTARKPFGTEVKKNA